MNINTETRNSKITNRNISTIVGIVVIVVVVGFVSFLELGSYARPSYSFLKNEFTVSGQYGVKINLLGATVRHELAQVPTAQTRTNGAAIGKIEKGYFKISGSEVYMNIMDEDTSNYILIMEKNGAKYYINCVSFKETNRLYDKIMYQMHLQKIRSQSQ